MIEKDKKILPLLKLPSGVRPTLKSVLSALEKNPFPYFYFEEIIRKF